MVLIKTQILCLILLICAPVCAQQDSALFPIQQGDRWGYIDRSGKIVIEPRFREADEFSEGLAAVELTGRWGFIDASGKVVVEPQYSWANRFSEGLARVRIGAERYGKWGFIDRSGQMVIEPQFVDVIGGGDGLYDFHDGFAVIEVGS